MEEKRLLQSWKEISDYLNCSVRTCHRWEEDLELPIHRLDGTPKARVFAYPDEIDRWRAEKLHSAEAELKSLEALRRRKNKRIAVAAGAAIVVAAISFLAWNLFFRKPISPQPFKKPILAVLPFENLSGSKDLDWLSIGLPELIMTDLLQSKFIEVQRSRVYSILKEFNLLEPKKYSREDLLRIAKTTKADRLGIGSISKAGENIIIALDLQNARSGEPISSRRVTCKGEADITDRIDKLTKQIKADLNLGRRQIARDIDEPLGRITSRSPEALKYYTEGLKESWKGNDLELAKSFFRKAIAVDPEFAMAYLRLSSQFITNREDFAKKSNREDQAKYIRKALDLSNRISTKERYYQEAIYYRNINPEKALESCKKWLELYPDDELGIGMIANIYSLLQDYQNALKYREIQYEKNKTPNTRLLASLYENMGSYDKAIGVYQYYLQNENSADSEMREALYRAYWRSGEYEVALREADRIEKMFVDAKVDRIYPYYLMGNYAAAEKLAEVAVQDKQRKNPWMARDWLRNIYITQGQFGKAKQQILLGLQEEENLGSKAHFDGISALHDRLASIYLIEGNLESADNEADKAWEVCATRAGVLYQQQCQALITRAEIYLEMKQFDKAQEVAQKIYELINKIYADRPEIVKQREMKRHDFVLGKIELKKGNLTKAIDHLKKAQSLDVASYPIPPSSIIVALADAYEKSGKLPLAWEEYAKIPLLTNGRLLEGYTYATSYYRMGKICEQQNDRAKAVENYGKFIDLWKNADRGLPEVEDAKTRLATLMSR